MLTGRAARQEQNRDVAAADSEQQRDSPEKQVHRRLEIAGVGFRQPAHTDLELLGEDIRRLLVEILIQRRNSAAAASKLTPGFNFISGPYL